jgi:hypothetical protein
MPCDLERFTVYNAPTGGGHGQTFKASDRNGSHTRGAQNGRVIKMTEHAVARPGRAFVVLLAMITALMTALVTGVGTTPASAKPRTATPDIVAITGTATDGSTLTGTFDVSKFVASGTQLLATGTLTGTITDTAGTVTQVPAQQITLPVNLQQSSGSCQILDLVLGPLDLDLLGLQVHLDQVHLNITAQSGPGNLLGNLLCAVAGLLDGPTGLNAIVTQIAALLNQILGILG